MTARDGMAERFKRNTGEKQEDGAAKRRRGRAAGSATADSSLADKSLFENPWEKLVRRLPQLHAQYLKFAEHFALNGPIVFPQTDPALKPGEIVRHGRESWPIKAILGSGAEGCVYLVDTAEGEQALKCFFLRRHLREAVSDLGELEAKGVPVPKIFSVSHKTQSLLMEYIPSIPLSYLFNNAGLKPQELGALMAKAAEFRSTHPAIQYSNTVIDVRSLQFRFVDKN